MVDFAAGRRSILANLLKSLSITQPEAPVISTEPRTMYVEGTGRGFPGRFIAIELWTNNQWGRLTEEEQPDDVGQIPGVGWMRVRTAHRAEAMDDSWGPNPEPVDVEIIGGPWAMKARYWNPGDAEGCRRCVSCNVCLSGTRPGLEMCLTPLEDEDPGDDEDPIPEPEPSFDYRLEPAVSGT